MSILKTIPPSRIMLEPYRVFFPIGWIMGILGVSYWFLVSTGITKGYLPQFHALIQIELFASAFAVGFLLTALPKFFHTKGTTKYELLSFLTVYLLLACSLFADAVITAQWFFITLLLLIARFGFVRFRQKEALPPFPFLLVIFGLVEGAIGAFLFAYPSSMLPLLGSKLLEQGMFLSLSLGVGSFLVPRLMGVIDTANAVITFPGRNMEHQPWYRRPDLIVILIGSLIFVSFFVEVAVNRELGMFLRVLASTYCLYRFNILKLPKSKFIIGHLVAVSMWLMVLGIFVAALFPAHEVGALHLTYIGGFALLILSIGAQVISGHGGVMVFWRAHRIGTIVIALLIALAMLTRVSATFFGSYFFNLISISALLFILAMIIWGIGVLGYVKIYLAPNDPGDRVDS